MDLLELGIFALALLIMLLGFVGAVLPGIPSTPLVVIGAIVHRLILGADQGTDWWVVFTLLGITVFSLLLDYLASMAGAKRLGATKYGIGGAVVGAIVGIFFGLPGILLGPFAGALLFELVGGRNLTDSGKAGLGAVLGLLAGAVGKVACCLVMILIFSVNVLGSALF